MQLLTIWFLRHQAEGILHSCAYASRPTDEQMAAVKAELDKRHSADCWIQPMRTRLAVSWDAGPLDHVFEPWTEPPVASVGDAVVPVIVSGTGTVS